MSRVSKMSFFSLTFFFVNNIVLVASEIQYILPDSFNVLIVNCDHTYFEAATATAVTVVVPVFSEVGV